MRFTVAYCSKRLQGVYKLYFIMARLNIVVASVLAICLQCDATKFTKCSLVHELRKQGFKESDLPNWVCLVQNESNFNPTKVSLPNKNGSIDYGLFQINDKYWCTRSGPAGKDCNVTCADVSKQDITQAATCAKKIFKRHGFRAWYGWRNHCQAALPDISSC